MLINNLQCDILLALSTYTYCAVSHFKILTHKSDGYLREMLGKLVRYGYIRSFRIYVSDRVRSENLYSLTKQGAQYLIENKNAFADEHTFPIASNTLVRDYFHRHRYVSYTIAARQFFATQNVTVDFLYSYFTKTGSTKKRNLTAKTTIPLSGSGYYVPDGVLKTGSKLYLLELYNDYGNIKRIITSLATHAQAIALSTPGLTFGVADNPIVLAVFTHESTMKSVIKKLQTEKGFATLSQFYYFASLAQVQQGFGSAFRDINNTPLIFI